MADNVAKETARKTIRKMGFFHLPSGLIVLVTLAAVTGAVSAQETETVYKCTLPDGRIVYSDQPCNSQDNGQMEVQTITAPAAGRGGEAALEGIDRLAREYDERREAERRAREEAERRALEQRRTSPEVVVVTPWQSSGGGYPYGYPVAPYDRYRNPSYGGGLRLNDDGLSLWFGNRRPLPRYHQNHRPPYPGSSRPPRDPYSVDGRPIKEPGYSGQYPGGFPGYR